ncbi:MAG: Fic/DOC family [bacterium F083]|nr:MAG: Fic/DOC family [bacterium F083]
MKNEIILFEDQGVTLEVNMKDETVWLNAHQMAELFDRDVKTVHKHIQNALKEELDLSTVAKIATLQSEGSRRVKYDLLYHNDKILIAESNPKEKNLMIDLIINLLSI